MREAHRSLGMETTPEVFVSYRRQLFGARRCPRASSRLTTDRFWQLMHSVIPNWKVSPEQKTAYS